MATPIDRSRPAPEFAFWPFNCLSLYTRMARDVGGCAEAVVRSNDAMDAVRAETELGAKLFADLMKGYCDLALAPWTAMAEAMVEEMQSSSRPDPEPAVLLRRPRGRPHRRPAQRPTGPTGPAARRGG